VQVTTLPPSHADRVVSHVVDGQQAGYPTAVTSSLVLPAHPSSIRLGRHALVAWLQFAPQHYDKDMALLLVTELLANAVDHSSGPLMFSVRERDHHMRVEVSDAAPLEGFVESVDGAQPADDGRQLKMIKMLADSWGREAPPVEAGRPLRVVWFECGPPRPTVVSG
jgi:anti-sigma regulatory factor (Ser/Thr protein kinase)